MKKVKLMKTDNFRHQFVVYSELQDDHSIVINEKGEVVQSYLPNMNIDTLEDVRISQLFRLMEDNKKRNKMLDQVYRLYLYDLKNEIEDLLNIQLMAPNQSSVCYEDAKNEHTLLMYFAQFDEKEKRSHLEIQERHLQFLNKGQKKMVMVFVEGLDALYFDGQSLMDQIDNLKSSQRKKGIELVIHQDGRVFLNDEVKVQHFSSDINFFKDFQTGQEKNLFEAIHRHQDVLQLGDLANRLKKSPRALKIIEGTSAKILPFKAKEKKRTANKRKAA